MSSLITISRESSVLYRSNHDLISSSLIASGNVCISHTSVKVLSGYNGLTVRLFRTKLISVRKMKEKERQFLTLGRNIASMRESIGMNQELFAHKIGMAISSLKDIERGLREGRIENRKAMAKMFGCNLSDLYNESTGREPHNFIAAGAFLSKYAGLSPKLQKVVWAIVFEDPDLYEAHPDLKRALK